MEFKNKSKDIIIIIAAVLLLASCGKEDKNPYVYEDGSCKKEVIDDYSHLVDKSVEVALLVDKTYSEGIDDEKMFNKILKNYSDTLSIIQNIEKKYGDLICDAKEKETGTPLKVNAQMLKEVFQEAKDILKYLNSAREKNANHFCPKDIYSVLSFLQKLGEGSLEIKNEDEKYQKFLEILESESYISPESSYYTSCIYLQKEKKIYTQEIVNLNDLKEQIENLSLITNPY